MNFRRLFTLIASLACVFSARGELPAGYKLLYSQQFTGPENLRDFAMTDQKAWRVTRTNEVTALDLVTQSKYKPAFRSPFNIALIADKVFKDFILEANLMQT